MTKEDIKTIIELFISWNGENEPIDISNLDYAIEYINDCIKSSSPSNLDEAVTTQMEEDGDVDHFVRKGIDDIALKYAKLGAEWMAGQGIVGDAEVCKLTNRAWVTILDEKQFQNVLYDKFNAGDKVVVQIRKK